MATLNQKKITSGFDELKSQNYAKISSFYDENMNTMPKIKKKNFKTSKISSTRGFSYNSITPKSQSSNFTMKNNKKNKILNKTPKIQKIFFVFSSIPSFSNSNFTKSLDEYSKFKSNNSFYNIDQCIEEIAKVLEYRKTITMPSATTIQSKLVFLERIPRKENKKTIIFDLEDTLIHYCDPSCSSSVEIKLKLFSEETRRFGLLIRPYALECLKRASELFEVIIFSSFSKSTSNKIIDYLDPSNSLIDHRLFQDSCIPLNEHRLKDLRIFLNRQVKNLIIIDNSVYNFMLHIENGIPINS